MRNDIWLNHLNHSAAELVRGPAKGWFQGRLVRYPGPRTRAFVCGLWTPDSFP